MPVHLTEMRDLLLPGLREITYQYKMLPLQYSFLQTKEITAANIFNVSAPPSLPIGPGAALALGAAAAIVRNPEVSRRGLFASLKKKENTNG